MIRGRTVRSRTFVIASNGMAIELTDGNFEEEVLKSGQAVLVDFFAPWCGPCQMMLPIVEELSQEMTTVKIGKLNVDGNPETAAEYGIMSIPSLKIFKDGKVVREMMGVQSKEVLKEALSNV